MTVHYRTQGFILTKKERGEADQLFSVFTKDFGRLEILGKAIRKIKSKLRGGAELFYLSEIEFIQGKGHKTLTDAITIEKFKNIRKEFEKIETANQIVKTLDDLVSREEKDEKIWNLVDEIFNKLNNEEVGVVFNYFVWNLLSILGYEIDLYNCSICQKKLLPGKLYFNAKEGGIIDSECFQKIHPVESAKSDVPSGQFNRVKEGEEITSDVVKILRLFLKKDWQVLLRLKIEQNLLNLLKRVSENYLFYYTSDKLRS